MFNCHPSLLPYYIGMGAVQKSFTSNDLIYGATIHYATKDVDCGEPVARCVLHKRQEEFADYNHRLFVNQAFMLLNFIYTLGTKKISPLKELSVPLDSLEALKFAGFNPRASCDLKDVKFFNPYDKEFLEL